MDVDPRTRVELSRHMVAELRDRLTGQGVWVVHAPEFGLAYTAGLTARGLPELLLIGAGKQHVTTLTALAGRYAAGDLDVDTTVEVALPSDTPHRWTVRDHDPAVHPDLPVARGLFGDAVTAKVIDVRSCRCDACTPDGGMRADASPPAQASAGTATRIDPDDPVVQYLFKILDIIEASGWAVQFQGSPGSMLAYTVGMSEKHWPELVTIGLDPQEAALVLNAVGRRCVDVAGEPRHGMEMVLPEWNHRAVRLVDYVLPAQSLTVARRLYSTPPYILRALEVRRLD